MVRGRLEERKVKLILRVEEKSFKVVFFFILIIFLFFCIIRITFDSVFFECEGRYCLLFICIIFKDLKYLFLFLFRLSWIFYWIEKVFKLFVKLC